MLIGNNLALIPESRQFAIQLFEFMVLILKQLLILSLNIILPLQCFIPAFEEHLIFVTSILHIRAHLLVPVDDLVFCLFADEVLTGA